MASSLVMKQRPIPAASFMAGRPIEHPPYELGGKRLRFLDEFAIDGVSRMKINLHDHDFHAWSQTQVDLLKARQFTALDVESIIEELEAMGASERRQLINRLAILLAHLLKWQHQPSCRGRSWTLTTKEQRRQLARHLRDNPSLEARIDEFLMDAYGDAVLMAASETGFDEDAFPDMCAYTWATIMDVGFLPD